MDTQRTLRRRGAAAGLPVLAAAALALSACGAGSEPGSGSGNRTTPGPGTHTVRTAMGDVTVKDHPQRVVVLDTAELDSAITLGVRPVGATHADVATGFLDYLPKDKVSGIRDVGKIAAPNLEAVAALKPDLILTNKDRDAARYQELSRIAPTVMTGATGFPWKANFATHAAALGRTGEARKVVADYLAHAKRVTAALGGTAKAEATEVNVVRFVEGANIRVYGRQNYIGTLLADVGLGRPAIVDKAKDGFSYDISPEQIGRADADAVFTATYGDPEKSKETQVTGGALWKNMKAVRNGRVFKVDDQLWIQGIGYTAAGKILDELRTDLTAKSER
ncbi:ABC transporter substrate-binding protein [Streptomyces varsoviensis]|uniref:Iron-siderophore ABC transporter substrate-binding protein n=1 Tax=Streptomyces varsoviensis TaxID=67373 RepID=A0ABR5IRT5_9ACTN|nr:iron-siderophore ABC transporter substrate-binding protein [Streptomyces varsoviensis]KOG42100.1 iron-siderophore ABC transporter substrate-binding protein [Streptomyces varsoviensis]